MPSFTLKCTKVSHAMNAQGDSLCEIELQKHQHAPDDDSPIRFGAVHIHAKSATDFVLGKEYVVTITERGEENG